MVKRRVQNGDQEESYERIQSEGGIGYLTFVQIIYARLLREDRTMSELASEYGVHPITIGLWKKAVVYGLPRLFEGEGR